MSAIDTFVESEDLSEANNDLESMSPREQLIGMVLLILVVLAAIALQSL